MLKKCCIFCSALFSLLISASAYANPLAVFDEEVGSRTVVSYEVLGAAEREEGQFDREGDDGNTAAEIDERFKALEKEVEVKLGLALAARPLCSQRGPVFTTECYTISRKHNYYREGEITRSQCDSAGLMEVQEGSSPISLFDEQNTSANRAGDILYNLWVTMVVAVECRS